MERISLRVDERNGDEDAVKDEQVLEFSGEEIASFKVPQNGKERKGSLGTDFTLYRTVEDNFLLFVEHWSRRPGGENSRKFELFSSIEEMRDILLHENGHTVNLPRELINLANRALKKSTAGENRGN